MDLPVKMPTSTKQKTKYIIETKNLSYKLPPQNDNFHPFFWEAATKEIDKYILKNVNCKAKPREITAIGGPSGAGKTTLLNILAGVTIPCRVSGDVLVNRRAMNCMYFRKASGYVTQDDALFPLLTVEETIMYTARLRLSGGIKKVKARMRKLLNELGLDHVAGIRVGDESTRGISGGEKRRVCIGVELVHDPAVLLIDEPTSALDSAAALNIMLLLHSLAKGQGKTIVLTIHQPGFRILELVDQVILLYNGVVLHHGSLYRLEQRLNIAGYYIPRHVNVLEFAIDMRESLLINMEDVIIKVTKARKKYFNSSNCEESRNRFTNSFFEEVLILSRRFSVNIFRTKHLFAGKLISAAVVGVLLGTVFMNATRYPKKFNLKAQVGFFAFSLTFLLSSTIEALPVFLQDRRILMRETSSGAYRVSSYVTANVLVFVPFLLAVALLYAIPVYLLIGLRPDIDAFLYFTLVVWLVVLIIQFFCCIHKRTSAKFHNRNIPGIWADGDIFSILRVLHIRGLHTKVLDVHALFEFV